MGLPAFGRMAVADLGKSIGDSAPDFTFVVPAVGQLNTFVNNMCQQHKPVSPGRHILRKSLRFVMLAR